MGIGNSSVGCQGSNVGKRLETKMIMVLNPLLRSMDDLSENENNSESFEGGEVETILEQEKLVTDLNLTESKSANTDKDVEMSDPEKSPKRDLPEDVDMSNDDNEEENMEANPNLNQSRISD